jgi:metallo-beta-lactamase family protein
MDMKIGFFGAAQNVTGSRYLLEANGTRLLVDCGLYQERDLKERNWAEFPVPPGSIDAILLTHAHLDHSGFIPKLAREGFSGKVYCTGATAEIAKIALIDSAHVLTEDAKYKKKRHDKEGRKGKYPDVPLYTEEDARNCYHLFSPVKYEKPVQVGDGIEATYYDAGHILGASMIRVRVSANGDTRTLLFSGDIGRWNKPILNDPTSFEEADYVVVESTYGDRQHEDPKDVEEMLADAIDSARRAGGNIVIPSFAIERAQEVIYHLNCLMLENRIPPLMVFLDSPMAIRVTEVFKRHPRLYDEEMKELVEEGHSPFDCKCLKMSVTVEDSKAINYIRGTIIIIAGSGMCTGGRIKHHLVNNISRPESTVLFVGYQAVGTLGREIVEGGKQVRIFGQPRTVKAKVRQIQGFSAHADRDELMRWLSSLKRDPRHVFVTHGEDKPAHSFASLVHREYGWKTSVPAYGTTTPLP